VKLVAVGDVVPGDHYFTLGHGVGTTMAGENGDRIFSGIADIVKGADISIANLEGPVSATSNRQPAVERAVFRGPPGAIGVLKRAGFSVINVANNHVLQHGVDAFRETVRLAEKSHLDVIGVRGDAPFHSRPFLASVHGIRIAIVGYSQITERYVPNQECYAYCSFAQIESDVVRLKQMADVVVVSIHYGVEGARYPRESDRDACRALIECGANVVLGHHAHVFQPIESYRRGVIAYNLGNFVFDLFWEKSYVESAILEIDLTNTTGKWIADHSVIPVVFGKDYRISILEGCRMSRFIRRLGADGSASRGSAATRNADSGLGYAISQTRKAIFFLQTFFKGNTKYKVIFIIAKAKNLLGARRNA
jgi:poly-gamma-glutamate synthesis protein (capsule biosynthesis protein)